MAFVVRPYQPSDREAVRTICCETGIAGNPMDTLFGNRELFADLFSSYYTDFAPEASFVLESKSREVVGYLLGSPNTKKFEHLFRKAIVPRIIKKFLTGKYGFSRSTLFHIKKRLEQLRRGESELIPPLHRYPAHLHINLLKKARGKGGGQKLMHTYFHYLLQRGISGVHLGTTSRNREAIPFYLHLGWTLYGRQRTILFREIIREPVFNLLFVKDLKR